MSAIILLPNNDPGVIFYDAYSDAAVSVCVCVKSRCLFGRGGRRMYMGTYVTTCYNRLIAITTLYRNHIDYIPSIIMGNFEILT